MRNRIKTAVSTLSASRDRIKYRKYFPKPDGNLDLERHIAEAAAWLGRAQDAGNDRGVAYGAVLGQAFLASYPETTGYIIPTFLQLAEFYGDSSYERRAFEMGQWEVSV